MADGNRAPYNATVYAANGKIHNVPDVQANPKPNPKETSKPSDNVGKSIIPKIINTSETIVSNVEYVVDYAKEQALYEFKKQTAAGNLEYIMAEGHNG